MDVLNDWVLIALYRHDKSLGTYLPGTVGSVLGSIRLRARYPRFLDWVTAVHDARYSSQLSHAKVRKTGRPTGPVRFSFIRRGSGLLRQALYELEAKLA
jgi:hypothetical protein